MNMYIVLYYIVYMYTCSCSSCLKELFINCRIDHKGAVIIHEVNDGGAAQRDGRVRAGDQILEVLYSCSVYLLFLIK